ncbi:MAG: DUF4331 family protein [Cytophagales bacterium]|nr:DUF4331 family protein [Cytophagales bacterium]
MKFRQIFFAVLVCIVAFSCKDDNDTIQIEANAGSDLTGTIESLIMLDGSGTEGTTLSYQWEVTSPSGASVNVNDATMATASFRATEVGTYDVLLTVTTGGVNSTDELAVVISNVSYAQEDIMGRPGINTVFNFFSDEDKDAYNKLVPSEGSANAEHFKGILNTLQTYIGLDAAAYTNVLGLDNETTASVLSVDVLNCNKEASSTYGPSDLGNIELFNNVLNGRRLQDDVIDVTLILAFFGDGNTGNELVPGLISDNVQANDKEFLNTFPYLATPH